METMKKTYVRPEEMVVELKMEQPLLTASDEFEPGTGGMGGEEGEEI